MGQPSCCSIAIYNYSKKPVGKSDEETSD